MNIKVFGGHQSTKVLPLVKFGVKSIDGMSTYVSAFVSEICKPLSSQYISLSTKRYPHLENLKLADHNLENIPLEVDVLIGADFYWSFLNHRIVRGPPNSPVAIDSKLRCILSGPIRTPHEVTANTVSTHVLKTQTEFIDTDTELTAHLNKFWVWKVLEFHQKKKQFKICSVKILSLQGRALFSENIKFTGGATKSDFLRRRIFMSSKIIIH